MAVTKNFKYLNWLSTFQLKNLTPISFFIDARDSAGTNQFFIREAFELIKSEVEKNDNATPDVKEIEIKATGETGYNPKASVVFDEIYAQDMFAVSRVILLQCPSSWLKDYFSQIEKLLSHTPEGLFLLINTPTLDSKTKAGKLIFETSCTIEFPRMFDAPPSWGNKADVSDNDYTRWIVNRAKKYQKNISLQNAMLILTLIGTNLKNIDNQLNLLSIYDNHNKEIKEDHIKALIRQPAGISVFKVIDAIMSNNLSEALALTRRMFLYGLASDSGKLEVDEGAILSYSFIPMLFKRFKRVLDTLNLMKKGLSLKEAAEELGIPSYFLQTLETDIKNFGRPSQIELAINSLTEADLRVKTSPTNVSWLAEEIILKLLGQKV